MTRESKHFSEAIRKAKVTPENTGELTYAGQRVKEIEHQEPDALHVSVQLEKLRAYLATRGVIIPPCPPKPAKTKPVPAPVKRTITKRSAKV